MHESSSTIEMRPLTPDRWSDLEALFGPAGGCVGCWCMFWRAGSAEYREGKGEGNRRALRTLVESGEVPGLLAYDGGHAVGWCAIAPREEYSRLARSRTLRPVDERAVWSVPCFFVAKSHRRRGMVATLLRGAIGYAGSRGATIVEGYPIDRSGPRYAGQRLSGSNGSTGIRSAFLEAGFTEVARPNDNQVIMRYVIEDG